MKTKSLATLPLMLMLALPLFAAQTTVTGVLTDDMCVKKHMMPGKSNADCVRDCIKHGAKYVLVSEGKVLKLQGNQNTLNELAGKKIVVTGELKGDVLTLSGAKLAD